MKNTPNFSSSFPDELMDPAEKVVKMSPSFATSHTWFKLILIFFKSTEHSLFLQRFGFLRQFSFQIIFKYAHRLLSFWSCKRGNVTPLFKYSNIANTVFRGLLHHLHVLSVDDSASTERDWFVPDILLQEKKGVGWEHAGQLVTQLIWNLFTNNQVSYYSLNLSDYFTTCT